MDDMNGELQESDEDGIESVSFHISLGREIATRDADSYNPEEDFANTLTGDCDISMGKEINAIYYKAFEKDDNGNLIIDSSAPQSVTVSDVENITVSIKIDRTKAYSIFFWAQHNQAAGENFAPVYSLSPEMEVTINYENAFNNDERLDAFYGGLDYDWKNGVTETTVTLYRPFAQVNIGSIIADWLPSGFYNKKYVKSGMTVSNVANKFSIITGKVVEGSSKYDVTFRFNTIFTGPTQDLEYLEPEEIAKLSFKSAFLFVDFNENGEIDLSPDTFPSDESSSENPSSSDLSHNIDWWRYERSRYISMAYFLVDSDEDLETASDVVDVRFNIGYHEEEDDGSVSDNLELPYPEMLYDNVAVRPNFRTNIVGTIFSRQQRIYVNLSPTYGGEFSEKDKGPDDSAKFESKYQMGQSEFESLLKAFYNNLENDILNLFDSYGCPGTNYFVLNEDVVNNTTSSNTLQIRWDYVLYGNGHTVKIKKNNSSGKFSGKDYFNIGPVRNLYITDIDGKNKIYIDDEGYVWVTNQDGELTNSRNQLHDIDGGQNLKSYDVCCSTGQIDKSDYYPS